MDTSPLVFAIFVIFTGAAVLSTVALFTRQSLLVVYIILGVLLGPSGFAIVSDAALINQIGKIGIIFLLFLLGLHLDPRDLLIMLRKKALITLFSSLLFAAVGYFVSRGFGFESTECLLIGISLMFSSTIIGLKLLPETILHHQRTGEWMIGVLLLQDFLAIAVLLLINASAQGAELTVHDGITALLALPGLLGFAYVLQRFVLTPWFARFDHIKEYRFLLALGWCLGMAELGELVGLSDGVGAFVAGVSIAASSPVALYIADNLRPLRDFFLVLFYFAIGAGFDWHSLPNIIVPATVLAAIILLGKPWVFSCLLQGAGERKSLAWEVGFRLGQASEFSLLVAYLAVSTTPALISEKAKYLIEAMTIITFIISCYWVVWRYPTPMSLTHRLHRE